MDASLFISRVEKIMARLAEPMVIQEAMKAPSLYRSASRMYVLIRPTCARMQYRGGQARVGFRSAFHGNEAV